LHTEKKWFLYYIELSGCYPLHLASLLYKIMFKILVPHNKLLGSGSFGAVYTHVDKITKHVWAVKKVDLGMVASSSYQKVKLFISNK